MAYTGYKIITYIDVNPQSPTFNTTRTERVSDTSMCPAPSSDWQEVSSFCEVDSRGMNTGYFIVTSMDMNLNSPTYGQTRDTRTQNLLLCRPQGTSPKWSINEETSYCQTKIYQPSQVEGETGIFMASLTDDNRFSPTFGQRIESALTESDWNDGFEEAFGEFPCKAPDTSPQVEEVSYACVLSETSDGQLLKTGEIDITGIDKNVYSPTYLQSTTVRRTDYNRCPPNNPNKCACSALTMTTTTISFPQSGTSRTVGFTLTSGCELAWTPVNWVTIVNNGNGTLTLTAPSNSGDRREGAIIFSVGKNSNCHTIFVDQDGSSPTPPTPSTCSVVFHVTNNTSSDVNGSVEIFYGQDTSRSFHFDVDGLSPGSSKNITKALTSDQCGQEINTAHFESPSLNTPMNVHGSRMLNDGTTVNLEIPNS